MKIILTKDVAKVGRRHEVKDLADGFARNFIIARGLGVVADEKNLAKLKSWQNQAAAEKNIQAELWQKLVGEIGERALVITAKANEQGHLFASLHAGDISRVLREQLRLEIPPEMIVLPEPIKTLGEHEVEIKTAPSLASDGAGFLKIRVEAIK